MNKSIYDMNELEWLKFLHEKSKDKIRSLKKTINIQNSDLKKLTDKYWDEYEEKISLQKKLLDKEKKISELEKEIGTLEALLEQCLSVIDGKELIESVKRKSVFTEKATSKNEDKSNFKNKQDNNKNIKEYVENEIKEQEKEVNKKESTLRKIIKDRLRESIDIRC